MRCFEPIRVHEQGNCLPHKKSLDADLAKTYFIRRVVATLLEFVQVRSCMLNKLLFSIVLEAMQIKCFRRQNKKQETEAEIYVYAV